MLPRLSVLLAAFIGLVWWRTRRSTPVVVASSLASEYAVTLLTRAAPYLRLPTSPDAEPEVLPDGSGLRCRSTGRIYPFRDGALDLLDAEFTPTTIQQVLDTPMTAWLYDVARDLLLRAVGLPRFATEVATIQTVLAVQPGDVVLDVACGHGNFTMEWAQRTTSTGLVIGLDISTAMLARAAVRVQQAGIHHVLLVRGDVHRLPLTTHRITKVNCSGGFHQLPDLPRAVAEITRVSAPHATLTASTFAALPHDRYATLKGVLERRFALHFVRLDALGDTLARLGYSAYHWSVPGGWFGYASARKVESAAS